MTFRIVYCVYYDELFGFQNGSAVQSGISEWKNGISEWKCIQSGIFQNGSASRVEYLRGTGHYGLPYEILYI